MNKGKFSYLVINNLSELLIKKKREQSILLRKDIRLSDVEDELAVFCELKRKSIIDIKRGVNQPSLPVAMQIAKFFNTTVEDIFVLKTKEELLMEKSQRIIELLKRMDWEFLSELNGLMEEYLQEVKEQHPELLEDSSPYHFIHDFYMNLPASGYIDDACDSLVSLEEQLSQKEQA